MYIDSVNVDIILHYRRTISSSLFVRWQCCSSECHYSAWSSSSCLTVMDRWGQIRSFSRHHDLVSFSQHLYSDQSTQWCCPTTALAVFLNIILLPRLPYSQIAHSLVVDCAAADMPKQCQLFMSDGVDDSLLFVQLLSDALVTFWCHRMFSKFR